MRPRGDEFDVGVHMEIGAVRTVVLVSLLAVELLVAIVFVEHRNEFVGPPRRDRLQRYLHPSIVAGIEIFRDAEDIVRVVVTGVVFSRPVVPLPFAGPTADFASTTPGDAVYAPRIRVVTSRSRPVVYHDEATFGQVCAGDEYARYVGV